MSNMKTLKEYLALTATELQDNVKALVGKKAAIKDAKETWSASIAELAKVLYALDKKLEEGKLLRKDKDGKDILPMFSATKTLTSMYQEAVKDFKAKPDNKAMQVKNSFCLVADWNMVPETEWEKCPVQALGISGQIVTLAGSDRRREEIQKVAKELSAYNKNTSLGVLKDILEKLQPAKPMDSADAEKHCAKLIADGNLGTIIAYLCAKHPEEVSGSLSLNVVKMKKEYGKAVHKNLNAALGEFPLATDNGIRRWNDDTLKSWGASIESKPVEAPAKTDAEKFVEAVKVIESQIKDQETAQDFCDNIMAQWQDDKTAVETAEPVTA